MTCELGTISVCEPHFYLMVLAKCKGLEFHSSKGTNIYGSYSRNILQHSNSPFECLVGSHLLFHLLVRQAYVLYFGQEYE